MKKCKNITTEWKQYIGNSIVMMGREKEETAEEKNVENNRIYTEEE